MKPLLDAYIISPTLVYAYHVEGPMQGICLKVIVPIGEQWL